MPINEEKEQDPQPCCKPFRLSELLVVFLSFILLFYLKQYHADDKILCSHGVLTILFSTLGSTLVVTFIDNLCQGCRKPIPNNSNLLSLLVAALMCLTAGITAVLVHFHIPENPKSHRTKNSLCLLAGTSFIAFLLYVRSLTWCNGDDALLARGCPTERDEERKGEFHPDGRSRRSAKSPNTSPVAKVLNIAMELIVTT